MDSDLLKMIIFGDEKCFHIQVKKTNALLKVIYFYLFSLDRFLNGHLVTTSPKCLENQTTKNWPKLSSKLPFHGWMDTC
jgi:hypothetical protein